jgi:TPP-dependent pyruvate/acetoin dehydrogenase alpha subunit
MKSGQALNPLDALVSMLRIRAFETTLANRRDHGFQLLSSGEEAVAVGLCSALADGDPLLTGGRSIGPALARGVDPNRLMAELLGKCDGLNQGRAGRGHVSDPKSDFFGAHAVVGGNISIAAGVALARKLNGDHAVVAVMFGDGACGQGALYETLNIAANWRLPLLFLCNNNGLSVSMPRDSAISARQISDIGATFGINSVTIDGVNVHEVSEKVGEAVRSIRRGEGPAFVECLSIRLKSHSTTARETRSREELDRLWQLCPIAAQIRRLGFSADRVAALEKVATAEAQAALAFADASPYPPVSEVLSHVG